MTGRPGGWPLAGLVLAHAAVTLRHGVPHAMVPVPVTDWQSADGVLVVLALPLAGLGLAWRGRTRAGGAAVLAGGAGPALFGSHYHVVAAMPDHVSNVASAWSVRFGLTAGGLSLLAVATAVAGGWLVVSPGSGP